MQEVLPIVIRPTPYPDLRLIGSGLKQFVLVIWTPVRWLLEALFTPPPGQRYIEEQRVRAMRITGHF